MPTTPTTPRPRRRLFAAPTVVAVVLGAAGLMTACEPVPTTCHGYKATITGTANAETITGTPARDVILGLGGNDAIQSLGGSDVICGGAGADVIYGGEVSDLLDGGPGSDTLDGGEDNDTLVDEGSVAADTNRFDGGNGDDRLVGGAGRDLVAYPLSPRGVNIDLAAKTAVGHGTDHLVASIEGAVGSPYNDFLFGDGGRNSLDGKQGDDVIVGLGGDDNLIGGVGRDRVAYSGSPGPVTVDLATRRAVGDGTDGVTGFEDLTGSGHADVLTGDIGPNVVDGGRGVDICDGGGGTDTLIGCP